VIHDRKIKRKRKRDSFNSFIFIFYRFDELIVLTNIVGECYLLTKFVRRLESHFLIITSS
jgi:hypothetical protein